MKSLASLEVKVLVDELQSIVNARLDSVYQPNKEELWLQLYGTGLGKKYLRIISGKVLYLTEKKPSGSLDFALFLRRYLKNARIKLVRQPGFERVIDIGLEVKQEETIIPYSLVIELFGQGNILLIKDNTIISALHYKKWKDRTILAKQQYVFPQKAYDAALLDLEGFARFLKESKEESLVKALAIDLGLGGVYAEEVCTRAGADKNTLPKDTVAIPLYEAVQSLLTEKPKGYVYPKDIVPLHIRSLASIKHEEYPSFNEALDIAVPLDIVMPEEQKRFLEKQEKLQKIIAVQEKTVEQLRKKQQAAKEKAEIIYNHYQQVKDTLSEASKLAKEKGWEMVKKQWRADAKEKTITIDL